MIAMMHHLASSSGVPSRDYVVLSLVHYVELWGGISGFSGITDPVCFDRKGIASA